MVSSTLELPSSEGESPDLTSSDVQQSEIPLRLCITCANEIPAKRLAARPYATQCVECLTAAGDVKPIKRFDETVGEDVVSTYFTSNQRIEEQIARIGAHQPSPRILADETEAAVAETKQPELAMERRAGDMLSILIFTQPEPVEEPADHQGE